MPIETRYDAEQRIIYNIYSGNVTRDEFADMLSKNSEVFQDLRGPIGILGDLRAAVNLPTNPITQMRALSWMNYYPMYVAVVGANTLATLLIRIAGTFIRAKIEVFPTLQAAEAYLIEHIRAH